MLLSTRNLRSGVYQELALKYALMNDQVWEVLPDTRNFKHEVQMQRGNKRATFVSSDFSFISTEIEADKIYQYCLPHMDKIKSFGDIDDALGVDSNELLPFTDNFSIEDCELLSFLNETIALVDKKIRAH